jgi:cytoskeletal protein CcmA (bactofilin family)
MSEALAQNAGSPAAAAVVGQGAPAPIVSASADFCGLLQVRGPARIDGLLDGEIVAGDTVWIGESARVRARIEARAVIVAGELAGEVWAAERIELLPTARVSATLHAPRLVVAEGCFLEGRCHTGRGEPPPAPEVHPAPISP